MGTKTILVSFPHVKLDTHEQVYRVEKLTDSIEYNPGELLTKHQVNQLCAADDWAVTVAKVR